MLLSLKAYQVEEQQMLYREALVANPFTSNCQLKSTQYDIPYSELTAFEAFSNAF